MSEPMLIAKAKEEIFLLPPLANRHGLITGATGTGKTVTLQRIAEQFSRIGVPVFMADVKGDLSGMAKAGELKGKIKERVDQLGVEVKLDACPMTFWDVFGELGHPVRTTMSEMGPLLLARLLNLNETQQGVLTLTFKIADDKGLLLIDLKDLRAMLQFVAENAREFTSTYGNISAASVGAIQRGLLEIEHQGGELLFGEPALDIKDLMQTDSRGRGVVNILAADKLMNTPKVYATFLLWMLSELFEQLPEVGDPDRPKMAFFFDEAHLLFADAPAMLLEKIEQVVRLIRSKGVGVYFVTQNPIDIPEKVLGQLGNRVQHALRAFSPRDQKAVKSAATTMRANPELKIEAVITEMGVGEALVSLLDEKGRPSITERALVIPPGSQIGPITPEERKAIIKGSVIFGHYEQAEDRESAYEKLQEERTRGKEATAPSGAGGGAPQEEAGGVLGGLRDVLFGSTGPRGGRRDGMLESVAKSAARSVGSQVGREILRGVLGGILGGRRR